MDELIFVGERFGADPDAWYDGMRRVVRDGGLPRRVSRYGDNDPGLLDAFASMTERGERSVVVTTAGSYPTVSKLIATLCDDTLIHRDGQLFPSRAESAAAGSYRVRCASATVDVVRYDAVMAGLPSPQEDTVMTLHLFGYDLQTAQILLGAVSSADEVEITGYEHRGGWSVLIAREGKYGRLEHFARAAAQLLPQRLIDRRDIVAYLVEVLRRRGERIAFAESCTGGMLASMVTAVAGSSDVFDGSVVSYANRMKQHWLDVKEGTLEQYGAVSEPVALSMAHGIRRATTADYALAITGIAGPTGGSPAKPVGTVYIALSCSDGSFACERLALAGDRQAIREQACYQALRLLIEQKRELFCI